MLAEIAIGGARTSAAPSQITVVVPQFNLIGLAPLNPSANRVVG
jgi:hypothetical protein